MLLAVCNEPASAQGHKLRATGGLRYRDVRHPLTVPPAVPYVPR